MLLDARRVRRRACRGPAATPQFPARDPRIATTVVGVSRPEHVAWTLPTDISTR
ncbi:hypothetical protein SUDANB171_00270 [Streptomyces sp. enrichment culture]|uniref:hypothetical protein n=1 Tax=Streptomyces sp. enrichment culture TaxID=1795815 RepID=UPI003F5555AD